ncbi:MAG: DUF4157 domain-containing protein [Salinibacter sp.]|uniref:eCIS core domain-containing protein n=1 Tax=Salinibacter sp. TaxID=2065818 RepID=UPI002FC35FC0
MSVARVKSKSDASSETTSESTSTGEATRRDASSTASVREQELLRTSGPALGLRSEGSDTKGLAIHPELTVNEPGVKYKKKGDRVADTVLRTGRRKPDEPVVEPDVDPLQSRLSDASSKVEESVERDITSLRGEGRPLPGSVRSYFEPRFDADFGDVRIHTSPTAAATAQALDARAYTVGRHIVFDEGEYAPGRAEGRGLLAHELAHVRQQVGRMDGPWSELRLAPADGAAERRAERASRAAAKGGVGPVTRTVSPRVLRATRTFSLTFDDGPHVAPLGKGKNLTERVLDTLKQKGIKAGFFVQTHVQYRGGHRIGQKLIARMDREGHTIGVHTGGKKGHEPHPEAQEAGRLKSELKAAKERIKTVTDSESEEGTEPTYVRPPHGDIGDEPATKKAVKQTYESTGLTNLLWDIEGDKGGSLSLDELKENFQTGLKKVRDRDWEGTTSAAPKIVILYHDVREGTANNIGAIIDYIRSYTKKVDDETDAVKFEPP